MTGPALPGDVLHDDRTQHAGQGAHTVGQPHQDAGVARGDVQMVHVETCNTHTFYICELWVSTEIGRNNRTGRDTQRVGQGAHAVGQPHQDAGVARGDVKMVQVETCDIHNVISVSYGKMEERRELAETHSAWYRVPTLLHSPIRKLAYRGAMSGGSRGNLQHIHCHVCGLRENGREERTIRAA